MPFVGTGKEGRQHVAARKADDGRGVARRDKALVVEGTVLDNETVGVDHLGTERTEGREDEGKGKEGVFHFFCADETVTGSVSAKIQTNCGCRKLNAELLANYCAEKLLTWQFFANFAAPYSQ